MEELIQRIVAATGVDEGVARQAIGLILGFMKKHAPEGPVGDLINAIPGGAETVAESADAGGGLMGAIGGMLGGLGGAAGSAAGMMALAGQLKETGLDVGQIKTVGQQIFEFGGEQIGPDRMREIAASIPGVAQMMGKA
ncbi:MAG TPA: DUF2267 domain-containing protein [Rhodoblastus sp.]|nr:DUF2267 domain-containing protein [Rhodoblastus sp.]